MSDVTGYKIRNKVYPFVQRYRLIDGPLVELVTGLTWREWVQRLPEDEDDEAGIYEAIQDPVTTLGMVAVSVSQANPTWRRDRVLRFVSDLASGDIEIVGPELEEVDEEDELKEDQVRPPTVGANGAKTSSKPLPPSKSESAARSEASSRQPSGTPTSATSPE